MTDHNAFIPVSQPFLTCDAKKLVNECLDSGWISSKGAFVDELESAFAQKVGVDHAVSVSSGTAALHLALLALDVKRGDEVIVPDLTFAATANAVLLCGATPVLCSVSSEEWTLEISDLATCITEKTKAIIPVHLYGNPARMGEIIKLASSHGISVIEDCAESLGATLNGQHLGTFCELGCYSFFANKLMTTGEGGMVTTNDPELAQKLRVMRDHGMNPTKRYWHDYAGLNYRLTNLQAAIGVSQLNSFDDFLTRRHEQELRYRQHLNGVDGIRFRNVIDGAWPVNWLMSFTVDPDEADFSADELVEYLHRKNIETRKFFYPLHIQPPYFSDRKALIPVERLAERGISLPSFIGLTNEQIDIICEHVKALARQKMKRFP